jgi:hypothetical protein
MCEERYRLVNEYAAKAVILPKAALKLLSLNGEELNQARREFGAARSECNTAKEALLRHKTHHEGCTGPQRRRADVRSACG